MNARIYKEFPHRGWLAAAGLLLLAALVLPAPAAAAERVGRAISSSGDVTAFRAGESARSLNRGDPVYEGDEIRTGPNGRAQVRFVDQGLTNLSPSTTLAVDEYRIEDDDADGGGSAVLSFLRGAMRTITGLIGGNDEDTYRMNTPTATIGVRGTGYALQYCDAACAQEFGGEPGLYGRVDDGAIRVDTPRGSIEFGSGSYFFVPDGGVPRAILQPPAGVLDGEEDEGNGDGGGTGDGVAIIPVDEQEGDDTLLTEGDTNETDFEAGDETLAGFSINTIAAGVAGGFSGVRTSLSDTGLFGAGEEDFYDTDPDGRVIGAVFGDQIPVNVAQAELMDVGTIENLGVGWGRWEGDFLVGGSPATGNLAFTVTDNLTAVTTLSNLMGTFDYNLAGGPSAFEANGDLWSVDALSLNVIFGDASVSLTSFQVTEIDGSGELVFGSGSGNGTVNVQANTLSLTASTTLNDTLTLDGQFVGTNADGMLAVFVVDSPNLGVQVIGTSILEQQ